MRFTSQEIKKKIYTGFSNVYRAFGGFIDSGDLWETCLLAIQDADLMGHIIFCNDIHQIPPAHTFLKVFDQKLNRNLSPYEKRALGAFWGFVFKFVFQYKRQKSVTARVNTVKTASFFFEPPKEVKVENRKD